MSIEVGAIVLGVGAVLLTYLAAGPNVFAVDVRFDRWVQGVRFPFESFVQAFGNAAGSAVVAVPLALAAAGMLAVARRWADSLFLLALLAARALNGPLKDLAASPRPAPNLVRLTEHASGLGFPSGHSMGIVLLAGGLAYVVAASVDSGGLRLIACAVAVLVVLATGYARIATGAHWPSDVLGGYLWAGFFLLAAIAARSWTAGGRRSPDPGSGARS
jgi:membrane-associated phospholipid phosphatase